MEKDGSQWLRLSGKSLTEGQGSGTMVFTLAPRSTLEVADGAIHLEGRNGSIIPDVVKTNPIDKINATDETTQPNRLTQTHHPSAATFY